MRNLMRILIGAAMLVAPSVARAESDCVAKAELHVSLARSAGYSDPSDLADIYLDTRDHCVSETPVRHPGGLRGVADEYCQLVVRFGGSRELCEEQVAEYMAERAP